MNEKGGTKGSVFLIIVVLIVVGLFGWYLWDNGKSMNSTYNNAKQQIEQEYNATQAPVNTTKE